MASHKYGAACDGGAKQTLSLVFSVSPGDVRGRTSSPQGGDEAVADALQIWEVSLVLFCLHLRKVAAALFGPDSQDDAQNSETSLQTSYKTPGLRPWSSETFVAAFRS